MNIDLIEFAWIAINAVTFILTCVAIVEARADETAVKLLNGHARELAAKGIVRREWVRLYVQFVFLVIAIPSLVTVGGERSLLGYVIIGLLMSAAVALLFSTIKDRRDRQLMTVLVTADLVNKQETSLARIESKLDRNTEISQEASEHADAAYHEANDVNAKIARQGAALVAQGIIQADMADAADTSAAAMKLTVDETHRQVSDLHEGTAPQK